MRRAFEVGLRPPPVKYRRSGASTATAMVVNEGEVYLCRKCRREAKIINPGLSNHPPGCCEQDMSLFE